MKNIVIAFYLLCSSSLLFGQNKEVLFTIDNHPFYTDEFIRVYNKNLDLVKDDSQKDLDKYLDLFLGYKLKVEKANKVGLQNTDSYKNELGSYRNQLAKNYMNDSNVTNALIQEAYDRTIEEVRASHILILVDENAAPADTLKAYRKISDIRKRILAGENFDAVATKYSEDPSAKENKGDLGYFSAFKMVYPFENAAYTTAVGDVSMPFRTRFGYHILQVTDKRANRGEVEVAHIMILKPTDGNVEKENTAKETINDIYAKINQGESFDGLAEQFSEDKSTAKRGGRLQPFSSGQLTSQEFENVAFGLKENGAISKPFQSKFGWHIVMLINKFPVKTLEELKPEIESKIKRDDRSRLITTSLSNKLRAKYKVTTNAKLMTAIVKSVNNDFYDQKWQVPAADAFASTLTTINNDEKINGTEFLDYLSGQQKRNIATKPVSKLVDELYENWVDDRLIAYYNNNLENEFPEFRYVMEEYRDGLLLFDLMEKEIWEKAKVDSVGLEAFHQKHINDYMWKARYDVDMFSSTDAKIANKAKSYLKKGKSIDYIKEKLNKDGKVNIIVKSGLFEAGDDALPEFNANTVGVTEVIKKGDYNFVGNIKEIKPAGPKEMSECKGKLISDYQQYLESTWVDALKKEFTIHINREVFETVKGQLVH
ncbi:peptidylprolyl isomerase [Flavobacterium chuncheonense]|uniref:Peptidylprolyl isomerase n=1 Tax=Flavobacterium chuncheonense TaxID=2026653 RepID=A0ABW5YIU8_9FLAO